MSTRKQRTVKNAYVDIDSVTTPQGIDYCNWIPLTKEKLKQREMKLLDIKCAKIETVMNNYTSTFKQNSSFPKYRIQQSIKNEIFRDLFGIIDGWAGVKLARTKKDITVYRKYFNIGKNWYDLNKKKIFGSVFWLRVFKSIRKFCQTHTSSRRNDSDLMFLSLLYGLFMSKIKYVNTKEQSLINIGTITASDKFQSYLAALHPSLIVNKKETNIFANLCEKLGKLVVSQSRPNTNQPNNGNNGNNANNANNAFMDNNTIVTAELPPMNNTRNGYGNTNNNSAVSHDCSNTHIPMNHRNHNTNVNAFRFSRTSIRTPLAPPKMHSHSGFNPLRVANANVRSSANGYGGMGQRGYTGNRSGAYIVTDIRFSPMIQFPLILYQVRGPISYM